MVLQTKTSRKSAKKQTKVDTSTMTLDFGNRKIGNQNFSKTIALPKTALKNLGTKATSLKVELVQEKNGEKFIKLTPAKGGKRS